MTYNKRSIHPISDSNPFGSCFKFTCSAQGNFFKVETCGNMHPFKTRFDCHLLRFLGFFENAMGLITPEIWTLSPYFHLRGDKPSMLIGKPSPQQAPGPQVAPNSEPRCCGFLQVSQLLASCKTCETKLHLHNSRHFCH